MIIHTQILVNVQKDYIQIKSEMKSLNIWEGRVLIVWSFTLSKLFKILFWFQHFKNVKCKISFSTLFSSVQELIKEWHDNLWFFIIIINNILIKLHIVKCTNEYFGSFLTVDLMVYVVEVRKVQLPVIPSI